jgi:glycosyltransferase involved in cell wall biosynthesis
VGLRTLVVATDYPWPGNSGSRLRLSATVHALRSCGDVDLFAAVSDTRTDFAPPPVGLDLGRVEHVAIDDRPPGATDYLRALGHRWLPFEIPRRARREVQHHLHRFTSGPGPGQVSPAPDDPPPYDLVWYFQVRAWVLAGGSVLAPSVVDIDDLEDQKIEARAGLPRPVAGLGDRLRRRAGRLWSEEDARRWRRLHRRIGDRTAATVVCSDLDARRSGLPGVRVIPNGYAVPEKPVGGHALSDPPVVLFQGTLRYPPNADGARYLVQEIGPRLRRLVPGARIRLVGLAPPSLDPLDDPPSVTLTGQVPDITTELARADVVVIPLRYASGTRVKILEAFAHRIPVVSTTVGAEGLDVRSGHHLLVADDPDGIAAACARLMNDASFRQTIVDQAYALFLERYQSSRIEAQVVAVARDVVPAR